MKKYLLSLALIFFSFHAHCGEIAIIRMVESIPSLPNQLVIIKDGQEPLIIPLNDIGAGKKAKGYVENAKILQEHVKKLVNEGFSLVGSESLGVAPIFLFEKKND